MRILLVAAQTRHGALAAGRGRRRRPHGVAGRRRAVRADPRLGEHRPRLRRASSPASEAIVCVGGGVTNVVVHERGVPRFVRMLITGGNEITEAIASELHVDADTAEDLKRRADASSTDELEARAGRIVADRLTPFVEEVRGSIDYYRAQTRDGSIGRVLLTGGGSRVPGLADRLRQVLHVPVEVGPPAARRAGRAGRHPRGPPDRQRAAADRADRARARGASARRRRRGACRCFPTEVAVVRERRRQSATGRRPRCWCWPRCSWSSTWAVAARWPTRRDKAERAEADDRRAAPGRGACPQVTTVDTQLQERRAMVDSALAGDVAWTRLLQEIATVLPNDVWLTAFTGQKGGTSSGRRPVSSVGHDQRDRSGASTRARPARWLLRVGELQSLTGLWLPSSTKSGEGAAATDHLLVDGEPHARGACRGNDATGTSERCDCRARAATRLSRRHGLIGATSCSRIGVLVLWFVFLWSPQGSKLSDAKDRRRRPRASSRSCRLRIDRLKSLQQGEPQKRAELESCASRSPMSPTWRSSSWTPTPPPTSRGSTSCRSRRRHRWQPPAPGPGGRHADDDARGARPRTRPAVINLQLSVSGGLLPGRRLRQPAQRAPAARRDRLAQPRRAGGQATASSTALTVSITARMFVQRRRRPVAGRATATPGARPRPRRHRCDPGAATTTTTPDGRARPPRASSSRGSAPDRNREPAGLHRSRRGCGSGVAVLLRLSDRSLFGGDDGDDTRRSHRRRLGVRREGPAPRPPRSPQPRPRRRSRSSAARTRSSRRTAPDRGHGGTTATHRARPAPRRHRRTGGTGARRHRRAPTAARRRAPAARAPSRGPASGSRCSTCTRSDGATVADVRVNSTVYTQLAPGEEFAGSYKVVSLDGTCGSFLFGDERFRLCKGEEVLK